MSEEKYLEPKGDLAEGGEGGLSHTAPNANVAGDASTKSPEGGFVPFGLGSTPVREIDDRDIEPAHYTIRSLAGSRAAEGVDTIFPNHSSDGARPEDRHVEAPWSPWPEPW